jgi:hypothetical protein
MALIYCDGDCDLAKGYAKNAAEALVMIYPNHSWWVECKQGVLVIKHFAISGMIGMVRHCADLDFSATSFRHEIAMAAGELLERAGMPRGAFDGQTVEALDVDEDLQKHFGQPMTMKVIH